MFSWVDILLPSKLFRLNYVLFDNAENSSPLTYEGAADGRTSGPSIYGNTLDKSLINGPDSRPYALCGFVLFPRPAGIMVVMSRRGSYGTIKRQSISERKVDIQQPINRIMSSVDRPGACSFHVPQTKRLPAWTYIPWTSVLSKILIRGFVDGSLAGSLGERYGNGVLFMCPMPSLSVCPIVCGAPLVVPFTSPLPSPSPPPLVLSPVLWRLSVV